MPSITREELNNIPRENPNSEMSGLAAAGKA